MAYTEDRAVWFEGQGLWQHVPASDWNDWAWQLKNRITKLEELERYMTLTADERAGVLFASQKLALAITPYFFNLIDRDDPNCPIRLQMIRAAARLNCMPRKCWIRWAKMSIRRCPVWCTVTPTGCCFW